MNIVGKDHQIIISSKPENIAEVENFLEQVREDFEIPDEVFGNILVAMTEAVNNCIIHGNLKDPSKNVVVEAVGKNDAVVFRAADEGTGFDHQHLPDPTAPENLEKTTGRGVFLMRQLSDSLTYTNGGATVEMVFNLQ